MRIHSTQLLAGKQAESRESARHAGDLAIEFGPGQAEVLVRDDQGVAVGEAGGGARQGL
jgi:hypothetical protein